MEQTEDEGQVDEFREAHELVWHLPLDGVQKVISPG